MLEFHARRARQQSTFRGSHPGSAGAACWVSGGAGLSAARRLVKAGSRAQAEWVYVLCLREAGAGRDEAGAAEALFGLGVVAVRRDVEVARAAFRLAAAAAARAGDGGCAGKCLVSWGLLERKEGRGVANRLLREGVARNESRRGVLRWKGVGGDV